MTQTAHSEIVLRVSDTVTYVEGRLDRDVYQGLKKALGYQDDKAMWKAPRGKDGKPNTKWDGWRSTVCYNRKYCRCHVKKDGTHFPTGLISRARDFFKLENVPYKIIDARVKVEVGNGYSMSPDFEPRDYQLDIIKNAVKQQRGIVKMATGGGKCLGKGTPVLMYDGSVKKVEDITVGDLLMGPDSGPRKVLSLARGRDNMYRIVPKRGGDSFIVNEPHILSLQISGGSKKREYKIHGKYATNDVVNISVKEYLTKNAEFKHRAKGYRSSIDFEHKDVPLDPYFIGIWLGDGTYRQPMVTTEDSEIVEYLESLSSSFGIELKKQQYGESCPRYAITLPKGGKPDRNPVHNAMRELDLFCNKHIPHIYKCNSREIRLQLLAGLLDADGSLCGQGSNCYDLTLKSDQLASDAAYIARSLGLQVTMRKCNKTCCNNGVTKEYNRLTISGNTSEIPVKLPRRKAGKRVIKKDCLRFGFTVEEIGEGDYFGFEIDGDHLFMLGDFTVTHNTATASGIIAELGVTPFIFYVTSIDLLKQAKTELERFIRKDGKPIEVGMIGGGLCDIKDINIMTVQTAVRSLGGRFTKYDDEDGADNSKYDETDKEKIANVIRTCQGMICDEVQHWAAKTCQIIADHSLAARFRYGLSATPWRDEGDDLLIDACFGKPIVDINASFLIKKGILVQPSIYFVHMPRLDIEGSYQTVYKEGIVENLERNTMIANLADQMTKNGRQTLILVKHIDHGDTLESMIPDSFFINGTHTGKQREQWIQKMRDQEAKVTIATSIFDEGVDVKPLDGLILAGSGKSQTRALQRIGRVIRSYKDPVTGIAKKDAFVVDFVDNTRYLRSHSDKRRSIYCTEPEFLIRDYK